MEFGAEIDGSEDFFQVRISNITWYFVFLISLLSDNPFDEVSVFWAHSQLEIICCTQHNIQHMFDCPLKGVITIELTLNIEYHYSLLT